MDVHSKAGRLLAGLAVVVALLTACASGGSQTRAPATPAPASVPSEAVATPGPTVAATSLRTPTPPTVKVSWNLPYESANPVLAPGVLDVYAPAKSGPWPVVVMFHGGSGDKRNLSEHARKVADLGFVVFVPTWFHGPGGGVSSLTYDGLLAAMSQGACAVEFARAHAAEYGGDPGTMIVFGHSAGAHAAAMAAFARPEPSAGCLGRSTLGEIDALVTYEGLWLLSTIPPGPSVWDDALAVDPRVMDAVTPWTYLAEHKDQKVVMLVSEDPNASLESEFPGVIVDRPVGDLWAADSWLAVRDPSGDLRRQLEANGALADGTIGQTDGDRLLFSVLKAQGNPVTLDVMPDSSHAWLRGAGWDVFLAAFQKAAA